MYCEYAQIIFTIFVQNIELSKIFPKSSKKSINQKNRKKSTCKTFLNEI